ncbi:TspO/MBR family protein [Halorubrum sp. CBA1125]|uniref:TspO/MBR family protein n=1 Tax=Halorubrum sp. CBA1125 TaxID=2668072 RepID=UPI0018D2015C
MFGVHFVFNLGWSAVFFGLAVIVAIWMLIIATIWAFNRFNRRAALLLVPYLVWGRSQRISTTNSGS